MKKSDNEIQLRKNMKLLLSQNPNYFGNLSKLKIDDLPEAGQKKTSDTRYEELTCVGYNPQSNILTAIVRVKQQTGYSGGPCTGGSQEFVRFYLDYGDGVWIDHGVSGFNIHDLNFKEDLCYAVTIRIDPEKTSCCEDKPVLPKVRAILSWQDVPWPNTPDWLPIWGNVLERDIQIEPRSKIICAFENYFDWPGIHKIDPELAKKLKLIAEEQPPLPKTAASMDKIFEATDPQDELGVMRNVFPAMTTVALKSSTKSGLKLKKALSKYELDYDKLEKFIAQPDFNTHYEELHCVGLDRDTSMLHGIIQVKQPSGYSGDLCDAGSREFVAFYLDFGSGWEYQGTSSVEVHNIAEIPDGGLWYQVSVPADLDEHREQWCKTGRARIRGILSWNQPPAPNDPDHVAHWGDWEDCWIELKPWESYVPEVMTPVIDAIGSVHVSKIDGLGYADGWSIGATFLTERSPFGGAIKIGGIIAHPTSNNLQYRLMVKGPSDPSPKEWTKSFKADVTTTSGGISTYSNPTQTPTSDGWYNYLPQTSPVSVTVAENLLIRFVATEEGLHEIYMQVREASAPASVASGTLHYVYVDNTRPTVDVEITSGTGNCGKFKVGDTISGTFAMSDVHSGALEISVTPSGEAGGGTLSITSALPAPSGGPAIGTITETSGLTTKVSLDYPGTLNTVGVTSGTWSLDTTGMDPCGYNIRIWGEDRTVVNSNHIGWDRWDIEGFCVEEADS